MSLRNQNPAKVPDRVVVIGATGFVGRAICRRLEAQAVPVLALGRGDIDLEAVGAADALAGHLRPGDSVVVISAKAPCRNSAELIVNIRMMEAVTAALAKVPPTHVVYISSDAVYSDGPLPLTEDSPTAPTSLHGVMHLAREIMLAGALSGLPFAIVRPTLIYGLDDPHNGYGPNRFRRLAQAGQDIVLFGEGEERRDHVLVGDVAELVAQVLLHRSVGTVNACSGEVVSFRSAAEIAAAQFKPPVRVAGSPRVGPMPHGGYRPFDIAAIHAAFPGLCMTAPEEGFVRVCQQMKENADG